MISEENGKNLISAGQKSLRPALLIDRRALKSYYPYVRRLLVGLAEQSYPCMLVCPADAESESLKCPYVDHIIYPIFKLPFLWRQNRKLLLERLVKFRPTVLHCCSQAKVGLTGYLARRLDIPYVLTFYSFSAGMSLPAVPSGHCQAIVASSAAIEKELKTAYSPLAERIRCVNPGTFVEDNCSCFADSRLVPSIVIAQRLNRAQDFTPLINALRHLVIDGHEFVVIIIGTGRADRRIRQMIKSSGLTQTVTLAPDVQPLRSVFEGADIYIQLEPGMDSNFELLDAMSVGMVVAACRQCANELLEEDRTAVFFDRNDELSIYTCLGRLLNRRDFARQTALAGQERLRKQNSVSAMIEGVEQIYLQVQEQYKAKPAPTPDRTSCAPDLVQ